MIFLDRLKDGEMLLVLGRPGSGCSTFLKTIALQTEGYESVEGKISMAVLLKGSQTTLSWASCL